MKHLYLAIILSTVALTFSETIAFGQAPVAPKPVPNGGVMIEQVQGKRGAESKFTNSTDLVIGIIYDNKKLILKRGENKNLPTSQKQVIELQIFEFGPDRLPTKRYQGRNPPNAPWCFIDLQQTKTIK